MPTGGETHTTGDGVESSEVKEVSGVEVFVCAALLYGDDIDTIDVDAERVLRGMRLGEDDAPEAGERYWPA